jgi:hypothetical protein
MRIRAGLLGFIVVIQTVLFLTHFLLYETWTLSAAGTAASGPLWLKWSLGILSISFLAASLLAFRYTSALLRLFYRAAAVWLGLLSFLFLAAVSSWVVIGVGRLAGLHLNFHRIVEILFGVALLVGVYGVFNASWTRITRITVQLANLPEAWRGRKAALISDVHLGHVRNGSFLRRMVAKILKEEPDAIFIAGDLYDWSVFCGGESRAVWGRQQIFARGCLRRGARAQQRESGSGRFADYWSALPPRGARRTLGFRVAGYRRGSSTGEHFADTCS